MKKEQLRIEYVFDNASKSSLWNYVGTSAGLAGWFANEVKADGKIYTFAWGGHTMDAEMTGINPGSSIRFHWVDDMNPDSFFEFKLSRTELTGGVMLEITDYAEPDEREESIILWNKQIKDLKRLLGL